MATAVRIPERAPLPEAPAHDRPRAAWRVRVSRLRGGVAAVPLLAVALTGLVTAAALLPAPALSVHGAAGGSLRLVRPAAYVALAPLCDVWDALSLLTLAQHSAVLAWAASAFALCRMRTARRAPLRLVGGRRRTWAAESHACAAGLAVLFAFYAAGALVPRPMAALSLGSADELAVDLHSHTMWSHDGRGDFDAEASRRWHRAAGYAAAYVTDHRRFGGAEAGARGNPPLAGDGTVLLSAVETRLGAARVNVLGVTAADRVDRRGELDGRRLAFARARPVGGAPLVVLTVPALLDSLPYGLRFDALEIADGAPRGLAFAHEEGSALRRLAARQGAALVGGSDNHGWGSTAPSWTVVRLPGWRGMTPAALDAALRTALRRPAGVRVVERTAPARPDGVGAWLATPFAVTWHLFASATPGERLVWLAWAWALVAAGAARRALGRRRGRPERGRVRLSARA